MSNYGKIKDVNGKKISGYNPTDNIERKANRTGEMYENVGQNKAAHTYTTFGSSVQQAHDTAEEKRQKAANKAAPVKVFSDEEKKMYQKQLENKNSLKKNNEEIKYADMPKNCPTCKKGTPILRGHTSDIEPLTWWHCPSCETTGVKRLPENESKIQKGEGSCSDHTDLIKTHPQAFEMFKALSEAKKMKDAFDLIKAKMCKVEECHDDKSHEKKEKKAASKIKMSAQQILDLHKDKDR